MKIYDNYIYLHIMMKESTVLYLFAYNWIYLLLKRRRHGLELVFEGLIGLYFVGPLFALKVNPLNGKLTNWRLARRFRSIAKWFERCMIGTSLADKKHAIALSAFLLSRLKSLRIFGK
jgi:hypothetical protein